MIMRGTLTAIFVLICLQNAVGQSNDQDNEGAISFMSSQNVYIKFSSTENISINDTLFISNENVRIPVLVVKSKSSISCVCSKIGGNVLNIGDKVFIDRSKKSDSVEVLKNQDKIDLSQDSAVAVNSERKENKKADKNTGISGRFSAITYADISNHSERNLLKMRYVFSLKADNISGTKLSAESYVSFQHKLNEWQIIKDNIFQGLKIYNLNIKYDATPTTSVVFGRKINRQISSIGAIDGLQIQQRVGNFTFGGIAGTRPDYTDYGFNPYLFQYGAYINHVSTGKLGLIENTLAFMEQKNHAVTDRRFLYFQHSNSLIKNLYVFSSFEANLYKMVDSTTKNTFDLSSFYVLLRYRPGNKLSISTSYDLRNNVIYYESYKNYLDKLIDDATRQGLSASLSYRLLKSMTLGIRASYRYRQNDPAVNRNISFYLYLNKLPVKGMRLSITSNIINTSYLDGIMNGIRINQEIIAGKLAGSIQYRLFNGLYSYADAKTINNIAEMQFDWKIYKRLTLGLSYEALFEKQAMSNRVYLNLTQRF